MPSVSDKWNQLTMAQKAELIGIGVNNGLTSLNDIRDSYNQLDSTNNSQYITGQGPRPIAHTYKTDYTNDIIKAASNQAKIVASSINNKVQRLNEAIAESEENKRTEFINSHKNDPIVKSIVSNSAATNFSHITRQELEGDYGYIGGTKKESRQAYLNKDEELRDSILAIAKRYNINPNILSTRLAHEGPIDEMITHNNYDKENGKLAFYNGSPGPVFGTDDIATHLKEGKVKLREPWVSWEEAGMVNEHERDTESAIFYNGANRNAWSAGISAMAAELEYRRKEIAKQFPYLNKEELDRAAMAAYNQGLGKATSNLKKSKAVLEEYPISYKITKKYGGTINKLDGTSSTQNITYSDLFNNAYFDIMQKVAEDNYKKWRYNNSDEALVHALNDNPVMLPELVITPSKKDKQSLARAQEMFPKEVRSQILNSIDPDYQISQNNYIDNLYSIYKDSGSPKIDTTSGNLMTIGTLFDKRNKGRAHMSPIYNRMYNIKNMDNYLAELSHSYQFHSKSKGNALSKKPLYSIKNLIYLDPTIQKLLGVKRALDPYSLYGTMENQAHSVIEPAIIEAVVSEGNPLSIIKEVLPYYNKYAKEDSEEYIKHKRKIAKLDAKRELKKPPLQRAVESLKDLK